MSKPSKGFKYAVRAQGDYVLDYVESFRAQGRPCWFIGRGKGAGNTSPIPSGVHSNPREAWRAAALALGVGYGTTRYSHIQQEVPESKFEAVNFLHRVYYHIRNVDDPFTYDRIEARVVVLKLSLNLMDDRVSIIESEVAE